MIPRTPRQTLALLAVPLLLAATGTLARATTTGRIRMLPQANVVGTAVRLSDLAALEGRAVDFAEVEIGPAPEPGSTRRISGQAVLARLREAGMDDEVAYTIPATVSVSRAYQLLDEGTLRPIVEAQLGEKLAPSDRIEDVDVQRPARIPLGAFEVEVGQPAEHGSGGGFRHTDLRILQEGTVVATVAARVKIASFGPVVVARQPVARGALLRSEDLRVEERRLDELPTTVVTALDEAVGKEARVALAAGKPVTQQAVSSAALVKRGDVVRVTIEKGGMLLSVAGQALDTAGVGERVRVLNDTSKRELVGRVVDHGTVHVVY